MSVGSGTPSSCHMVHHHFHLQVKRLVMCFPIFFEDFQATVTLVVVLRNLLFKLKEIGTKQKHREKRFHKNFTTTSHKCGVFYSSPACCNCSMLPLLVKDGLLVPSVAATLLCYEVIRVTLHPLHNTATLLKLVVSACQCGICLVSFSV